jgi:hypothetical protein
MSRLKPGYFTVERGLPDEFVGKHDRCGVLWPQVRGSNQKRVGEAVFECMSPAAEALTMS